ncbi:MAG: electron transport complex subunit E [Clostridia bacterium]|nr:electron transport complex subunit E [Clostridia bacterium]
MISTKDIANQFKEGIITKNPVLMQLLGMCPTLAVTTSATNAIGMGIAATCVLICSNVFISLLRKLIPNQVRIAAYIVIIAGFVSAVELLIKAYFPALDKSLGLFIPLIVVNCIILARAEAFASKNPVLPSAIDGLTMGLGFTLALLAIGSIREILGSGSIFGIQLFGDSFRPIMFFILPAGAFMTLGFVIAIVQFARGKAEQKELNKPIPVPAVKAEVEEVTEEPAEEETVMEDSEIATQSDESEVQA